MFIDVFIKEPTKRTPWIKLEPGKIMIMGRSIPDSPGEFFTPVLNWITEYIRNYGGNTNVELGFEYLNTSSAKWIYLIIKTLAERENITFNTAITWYYEEGDDDMSELGHMLRSIVECPFDIIEVEEMNPRFVIFFSVS